MASTITVQRGDTAAIALMFSNPDGSAYNAAGSTLTFTVRKSATTIPVITKPVTSFTNSGSGATISLSQSDLTIDVRAWRYEIVLVDGSGNRKSSGLNAFYVTENNGQPSAVSIVVGDSSVQVAVTVTQTEQLPGIPLGGSAGQILTKKSNLDNDTDWETDTTKASKGLAVALAIAL